jgi:hypothetical protein
MLENSPTVYHPIADGLPTRKPSETSSSPLAQAPTRLSPPQRKSPAPGARSFFIRYAAGPRIRRAIAGETTNSRAPLLHGHYSASSLVRTHPPPSRRRSISRLRPVIRSTLLRRFPAGTRRASPVARHVLVTVLSLPPRRGEGVASARFRHPMLPSPFGCGLGPRVHSLSRPLSRSLSLRPGDSRSPQRRPCR